MRLNIILMFATGMMLLLVMGCDSNPSVSSKASAETAEAKVEKVGKGLDGATPALPDKKEDMALIERETKQYEAETAAFKKARDRDLGQIEDEKISNKAPSQSSTQ